MASWGRLLLIVSLLCGCGGASATETCGEVCSLPDSCFREFDVPNPGDDCLDSCRSVIDEVGVSCVASVVDAIDCLDTCDLDTLTNEELLACEDPLLDVGSACD